MEKKKRFSSATAIGIIFHLFMMLFATAAANAITVWTDHATVKIRPNTPAKTDQTSASLKAARNEFEAFQLVITADKDPLSGVDVTVSDLNDGHGNTIPASNIMIYKEAYININTPSTTQGATGAWPDALIPKQDEYAGEVRNAFPTAIGAGVNQPVWVEIYIPQSAAAGVYSGSATVTATGQNSVVVPIQLTVWNFTLPSTSTLKSAYSIDYNLIPPGHGLGSFTNANSTHLNLVKLYAKANLLHRVTTNYLPAPYQMGNGDWSAFDTTFGPLLDGTEPLPGGKLPGAKATSYSMANWGHETDIPFMRDIATHAKAKGWFDRLFEYTLDEPQTSAQWQKIKAWANALHQADPDLRSLVTTSIQNATANGAAGVIDLFVPTIRYMDNKPFGLDAGSEVPGGGDTVGNQRSKYGAEVWWYQACGSHGCGFMGGDPSIDPAGYYTGWPSFMVDLPAMFNRIQQWGSFKYNIQGELYYDMVYAYGQADPWSSVFYFGGNGDGTLYYPGRPDTIGGTTDIPIESIRLKLLREGMEDYEYLNLLKGLDAAYADEQVARMVTNTYTWNPEPLDLYDTREKIAERIVLNSPGAGGGNSTGSGSLPVGNPAPGNTNTSLKAAFSVDTNPQDPWLINFDGTTSSDAEGPIASYNWDFGDGASGTGSQTSHRYTLAGSYNVSLTVLDGAGNSQSISTTISVTGDLGAPVAQWHAESLSSGALSYTFDGSGSIGGNGSLTSYEWDLGDQTQKSGAKIDHQYSKPGSYQVKLTVRNDKQKSATAVYTLNVGSASQPSGSGGGGGGGCSLSRQIGPTDFRQAISFFLVLSAPFWRRTWRKISKQESDNYV